MTSVGSPFALAQKGVPMGVPPPGITLKEYLDDETLAMLHPYWQKFPPEHPLFYNILALIYVVLGFLSISGNILVLYIFLKFKNLRTPSNVLVMNLALSDLLIMATLVPECVINFFMGGVWQFGDLACQIHAFCGTIFGIAQISTLIFISYDRFNVVVRGMNATPLTFGKVFIFIMIVWIWSGLWGAGPFFGFGFYAMDGILASCSYGYMEHDIINRAYITAMFVSVYIIPLSIIIFCYYHIVKAVFHHEKAMREQAKKMNVASLKNNESDESTEMKIAKVAMVNISLWVVAWTPFAVICLIGVHATDSGLTPMVSAIPCLFAKMSCLYNPIIYSLSHPRYRKALKEACPWFCIDLGTDSGSVASKTSGTTEMKTDTA